MITVVIKDLDYDNVVITRINFESKEQADNAMPSIMDDLFAMYGSGACGMYGVIEGSPEDLETRWSDWNL